MASGRKGGGEEAPGDDPGATPDPMQPVTRRMTVNGRRLSVTLTALLWGYLLEIAEKELLSVDEICARIDRRPHRGPLAATVRAFVTCYFHNGATQPAGFSEPAEPGRPSRIFERSLDQAAGPPV